MLEGIEGVVDEVSDTPARAVDADDATGLFGSVVVGARHGLVGDHLLILPEGPELAVDRGRLPVLIDLHTHSTASDGSDDPAEIPRLAAAAGCSAVALTDHDTLEGIAEAQAVAEKVGVELVPGCELSCEVREGTMHMLVYFLEPGEGPLQDRLVELQRIRSDRNHRMVDRLRQLGMDVTYDELATEAGGRGVGRPHAAAVLMRKGYVTSVPEAFDRFLAKGKPGYVEKERLSPREAVELARRSDAVPVLAHPFTLGRTVKGLGSVVEELAGFGLGGMECLYSRYSPDEREALARLAQRNRLVPTGGSDHHGTYKPDLRVGVGAGDLSVADQVLVELRARTA